MAETRPIFISIETHSYSGATLLAFLLGSHPQIATIGEMDGIIPQENPDTYLCSCGKKIKVCEFWVAVRKNLQAQSVVFDVAHFDMRFAFNGPQWLRYLRYGSSQNYVFDTLRNWLFHIWPSERRRVQMMVARNEAFIKAILDVTGKKVFVDSSKDSLRLRAMNRYSKFDVRAIHLIRDVRGVSASKLRRNNHQDVSQVAKNWMRLNKRIQIALMALPNNRHTLCRYEDLCADVTGLLAQLWDFCGVEPFDANNILEGPHHIIGNEMRLRPISEIKLDERWKTLLTAEQLQQIQQVALPFAEQYGYFK